jgi:hypothetical protein
MVFTNISRTPTVGLGCNSSAYLLYGLIATLVWLLQVLSASLSHTWAKRYEAKRNTTPNWGSVRAWAVYTRTIANALAVLNALWLVTFTMLSFTNLYNNCWCASSAFQWGRNTWVPTLMTPDMIWAFSHTYWVSGTLVSIACTAITLSFFTIAKEGYLFRNDSRKPTEPFFPRYHKIAFLKSWTPEPEKFPARKYGFGTRRRRRQILALPLVEMDDRSFTDYAKNFIQGLTAKPIRWWPLAEPKRTLAKGQRRIIWKCVS